MTALLETEEAPLHRRLLDRPCSAYAQGVQAVLTQVRLAKTGAQAPRVLLITSALPGEGKTSLAVSLAACVARFGQKALVVDLDLRRPAVAREFGETVPQPDLLEVLEGRAPLESAIRHDADSGVDILAPATEHDNPITLLTGARLEALLQAVDSRYDQIVIDTPPVLGVPDAKALAAQADAVLFVVQWDRTQREAAVAAMKELDGAEAAIGGCVLTRVDLKKHASYAYGDAGQYYHEYRKYYAS